MLRRSLKAVVLIKLFGAFVERMNQQGSYTGVLRYGDGAVSQPLSASCQSGGDGSQSLGVRGNILIEQIQNYFLERTAGCGLIAIGTFIHVRSPAGGSSNT